MLTNSKTGHKFTRAFDIALFKLRKEAVQSKFERAFDLALGDLFEKMGSGSMASRNRAQNKLLLHDVAIRIGGETQFQWLLECEAPSVKDMKDYGFAAFSGIATDSLASNLTANLISAANQMADSHVNDCIASGLIKVRASPLYPQYIQMAKDHHFPIRDLDLHLLYLANFNGMFALSYLFAGAIAVLGDQPDTLQCLRNELGDTYPTMENVDRFALLDSFLYESQRFFLRPTIMFKKAQRDFLLPSSSGVHYRVKKDEIVMAHFPLACRDSSVFANAESFDAKRFLREPHLKEKVFKFGFVHGNEPIDQSKFGCALHVTGFAERITKLVVAHFVQRVDFALSHKPIFTGDHAGDIGPNDIGFIYFRPRSQVPSKHPPKSSK